MAELSTRVQRLMQPHLRSIEAYDPNFTATRINLSANENTHPLPASVREAWTRYSPRPRSIATPTPCRMRYVTRLPP